MLDDRGDADETLPHHHIVLLGEADLSFALALGRRGGLGGYRVTATELGDPADVCDRYFRGSDAALASRCDELSRLGIRVVLSVCAKRLERNEDCYHWRATSGSFAKAPLWDGPPVSRFVFNFPHTTQSGRTGALLRRFFRSVRRSIACGLVEKTCRVEMRLRHVGLAPEAGGLRRAAYDHEEAAAAALFRLASVEESDLDNFAEFGYAHRTTERGKSCGHLDLTKVWRWTADPIASPKTQPLPPGTRRDFFFAPERIMDRKMLPFVSWKGPCPEGRLHYLVRWHGYPSDDECTWEQARDIPLDFRRTFDSGHSMPIADMISDDAAAS
eukprot:CAMPEP_0113312196 /NCGR_PEP_ID=MMETSP0010_2-20120614/9121_1 /TAXON_ID=216773 ORGANISM="Corethron hystrix, Strain 308" /NCGR_SAMPLE_ID=MMETSP0010_2 /ASSEMBLY_ACC=CAM_ASM_000155 /LENGTH=327 /DNA_ID=CAMNT_0000167969 /DNA_START=98 /DNA_END=1081 /DNA_ORIENTATION=- /assembly_acc=CAM_ASM_000155